MFGVLVQKFDLVELVKTTDNGVVVDESGVPEPGGCGIRAQLDGIRNLGIRGFYSSFDEDLVR